jgi:predicted Fe-Mo cluster-binding NifX family protein
MKIAVTAKGRNLSAEVDPRFGRAAYIVIVDTETMDYEVIDNAANVNAFKGAGIQAATMISERGVEVLLTGYCGPNAFTTLEAAGIKVGSDTAGTVAEAVETFKKGSVRYSDAPNAEGQW